MKGNKTFGLLTLIYGVMVTFLLLLILVPKIIHSIVENGFSSLTEIFNSFSDWSDPGPFFFVYLVGYSLIFWKSLLGSVIIILNAVFYLFIAGFDGPPIFAIPVLLVGILYLVNWFLAKTK